MMVVSPWSKGGWVCSEVFDHTSIIRFIERRFGVHEPNISPWRRTICGDLTAAFDFTKTDDGVPSLPDTSGYLPPDNNRHPDYVPVVPANPALPKQERGLRPARPLPYELAADATVMAGRLTVNFANSGGLGAGFHVTSPSTPGGPWTYTVGAGKTLSGDLPFTGGYDFTVHGPNGFLRRFSGGGVGPEVTARHVGSSSQVLLGFTNNGTATVRLTVTDAYGNARPTTHVLQPGTRVTATVDAGTSNGWYDLSVVSDQDSAFLRRLAGHVETGQASTSDPAIIAD
jgi:phospholipase C